MNGANTGGSDLEHENRAAVCRGEVSDGAFVLPEIGKIFGKGNGRYGKQGAVYNSSDGWGSICGEMEAMVIDGAETG